MEGREAAQEKLKPMMNLSPRAKQVIQGGVQDGLKRVRQALDIYGFVLSIPLLPCLPPSTYSWREGLHCWDDVRRLGFDRGSLS